jgi:hypothetical protein
VWLYTLLLPSFAKSGWLPGDFLQNGLFGLDLLRPQELFGMQGLDPMAHSLFWSMLANLGAYVCVSLMRRRMPSRRGRRPCSSTSSSRAAVGGRFWRGSAQVGDLLPLIGRFIGPERARNAFADYARSRGVAGRPCRPTPGWCILPRPRWPAPSAARRRG